MMRRVITLRIGFALATLLTVRYAVSQTPKNNKLKFLIPTTTTETMGKGEIQ